MQPRLISTFFKESTSSARAEVMQSADGMLYIDYYDVGGNKFMKEDFPMRSIHYVEDAAENWALGIKVLNG